MAAAATQLQPRLTKEQPRPRHRAKPKFDIPVETVRAETPGASSGWVYRGEAEMAPAAGIVEAAAVPAARVIESDPFETIAEGLFLVSLGSLRLLYRAVSAPFRLAGR
jgi:hypothetical protein